MTSKLYWGYGTHYISFLDYRYVTGVTMKQKKIMKAPDSVVRMLVASF